MHVAHSATFKGVAIYAGHIYYCAQDSQTVSLDDCGGQTLTQAQYTTFLGQSESYLDTQSAAGTIDNESNLHGQPVYLWSGTSDTTVAQAEMNTLQAEYQHYGANVTYDNTFPANHGWESPDGTVACGTLASPYMIVCNQGSTPYDSEQTWLTLFLGSLNPRNNGTLHGTLVNFGQTEFGAASNNGMDTNGYLFVPATCGVQQRCGLVLAFSGCSSTQADIQTKWVTEAGIDEWADSNNFVVLYPYTVNTSSNPSNSKGCWDWWGYDGANYSLKSGTQISIVYKMVQRIDPSAP
jgi:poly(3-hydroxybutyrate) depolymerase